jgi:hypothetical protein
MATRNDLFVPIPTSSLPDFVRGKKVITRVPLDWKLQLDDFVGWRCDSRTGRAQVVGCGTEGNKLVCTLQKVSEWGE